MIPSATQLDFTRIYPSLANVTMHSTRASTILREKKSDVKQHKFNFTVRNPNWVIFLPSFATLSLKFSEKGVFEDEYTLFYKKQIIVTEA